MRIYSGSWPKRPLKKPHLLASTILILLALSVTRASSGEGVRFASPSGGHEVAFTELSRLKFTPGERAWDFKNISRVLYRVDFLKAGSETPIASVEFNDVYGWEDGSAPTGAENIFRMLIWSPKEDFVVLPDEGWASAPGTVPLKALSLNATLPWKEARFAFNSFVWTDDLTGIGDRHDDCDYEVERFDGRTGKTIAIKGSDSPVGYELISVEGDTLKIRQVMDNCRVEEFAPVCLRFDLVTEKEYVIDCPAEPGP